MSRYWLLAAAAGLVSAAVFMVGNTGTPAAMLFAYLAAAPLFLAGLTLGGFASLAAGAGGVVLTVLAGGLAAALLYLLVNAAPVAILTRQALLSRTAEDGSVEWYPPGLLAAWLTGLGIAGLGLASLLLASGEAGLEGSVAAFAGEAGRMLGAGDPAVFASVVTPLLPGMVMAVWMLMVTVNGALGQAAAVWAGRNLRPTPDIGALQLPVWPAAVGAAAAVAGLTLGGDLGYFLRNLAVVAAVPFFLQGVAVVHVLSRRSAGGMPMLAVFYALLVVLGWMAMVVAVLGLVEQLAGIRARLARRTPHDDG